ncbi:MULTISPECIES: PDR/VanB family oxidoreductase [Oxalobacteraceae]|uniref:PDR/VanB family oxidoreductase n=1 Tax=Herminiimonas aquatilis TaxID=345342 RepID=A0ABW2J5M4_9BURK|nr:PDR/VanB family oxidoreductase [Janthinobacterium sp. Marseille]
MTARIIMKLMVTDIVQDTPTVKIYTLKHLIKSALPRQTAGAHVDVRLPDGKIRQYSLCGNPADDTIYKIAVRREDSGRGGSRWMHEQVDLGSVLHVTAPRNNFPISPIATRNIFIAGGIGITPFASMVIESKNANVPFQLDYCVRSAADAPLLTFLQQTVVQENLHLWASNGDERRRFDVNEIGPPVEGTHIYCCGPGKLVDAVRQATESWPESQVHFEVFSATLDENFKPEPFDIKIASTGNVIRVAANQSALEALHQNGFNVATSCGLGVCGSCECGYSEGVVIHRDSILNVSARQDRMMPCVSRARVSVTLEL